MSSFLEKFNEEIKDESNGIVTETNELEEDKTYLKEKEKTKNNYYNCINCNCNYDKFVSNIFSNSRSP